MTEHDRPHDRSDDLQNGVHGGRSDHGVDDAAGTADPADRAAQAARFGHADHAAQAGDPRSARTLNPLPGEAGIPDVAQRRRGAVSKKGIAAVTLLAGSLVAVAGLTIARLAGSVRHTDEQATQRAGDKPIAAAAEPRRLDLSAATPSASPSVSAPGAGAGAAQPAGTATLPGPRIPALVPTAQEAAAPIGVRRTGEAVPAQGGARPIPPEDAPVLLVSSRPAAVAGRAAPAGAATSAALPIASTGTASLSSTGADPAAPDPLDDTRRNLEAYQRQLQGLLDNLTRSTTAAAGLNPSGPAGTDSTMPPLQAPPVPIPASGMPALPGAGHGNTSTSGSAGTNATGLFGGQLQRSATPRVSASMLGNRSLTLPKGTAFTCALKTRVVSAASGFVGCQVQRNVFSDDGRVLLVERGSHLDGEYRITSVRTGTVRIPVLWTRIRTPLGVTVDIDSPGTGPLGESGIDGHVDNRWGERLGAAMLLSLIDDSVKLIIQHQASDTQAGTVILPSTTANTSKLAEKVLDSTINIPPLIYQNQGGIVGIYVARDVDFSSVYTLQAVAR